MNEFLKQNNLFPLEDSPDKRNLLVDIFYLRDKLPNYGSKTYNEILEILNNYAGNYQKNKIKLIITSFTKIRLTKEI